MHINYHGSRGKRASAPMAEINIIPLVDVVLVLLIIFMATTAFIKESGLNMKLPAAKTTEFTAEDSKDITIVLTRDDKTYLNGKASDEETVQATMVQRAKKNPDTRVIIKGDKKIDYDRIVHMIDLAKQAGFSKVSLGTKLPNSNE